MCEMEVKWISSFICGLTDVLHCVLAKYPKSWANQLYVIRIGTPLADAHDAQHLTLNSGLTQPPTSAMASHDVNCAISSPIFAVSSAITCAGTSMHAPPPEEALKVPNAAHRATIKRRARRRSMVCGGGRADRSIDGGRVTRHRGRVGWEYCERCPVLLTVF